MVEREVKNIKLIYQYPKLSGNQIYKKAMKQGFGIKKQEFYILYRACRKLPEPTELKKLKAVPIKYRKPGIVVLKPIKLVVKPVPKPKYVQITLDQITGVKKEGSYKTVEVIMDGIPFYIKYKTRKQFNKHLRKLKESYKHKKITFTFLGVRFYTQYKTDEFVKILAKSGL